jgi:hypothetical protein
MHACHSLQRATQEIERATPFISNHRKIIIDIQQHWYNETQALRTNHTDAATITIIFRNRSSVQPLAQGVVAADLNR